MKECIASHQSDKKDEAYEHMKSNLFTFLKTKIPFGRDDLNLIQYDPFVEQYKQSFITTYCNKFKIKDKKIVGKWYTDIVSDKSNWPILLEAIEEQIALSEGLYIKLKQEMKNNFISYANGKTDLTSVPDFHNVILKLKSPIMNKLSFTQKCYTCQCC